MSPRLALLLAPLCLLACSDGRPWDEEPKQLRVGSGPVIDYSTDHLGQAQDHLARGDRVQARLAFIRALGTRHRAAALRALSDCGDDTERQLCADAVRAATDGHRREPAVRLVARYLGQLRVGDQLSRGNIVAVAYDASGAPLDVGELFVTPGPGFSPSHAVTEARASRIRVTDIARQLSTDCPVELLAAQ